MTYDPLLDLLLMDGSFMGGQWHLNTILAPRPRTRTQTAILIRVKGMSYLLDYLPAATVIASSLTGLGLFFRKMIRSREPSTRCRRYNQCLASISRAIWSRSIASLLVRHVDEGIYTDGSHSSYHSYNELLEENPSSLSAFTREAHEAVQ